MTLDIHGPSVPLGGASMCCRNGREREIEGYGHDEERQNWTLQDSKQQPDMSTQWGHQVYCRDLARAATGSHIRVHGLEAVGICYHRSPSGLPWSRLPLRDMMMFEICAEPAPPPTLASRKSWDRKC